MISSMFLSIVCFLWVSLKLFGYFQQCSINCEFEKLFVNYDLKPKRMLSLFQRVCFAFTRYLEKWWSGVTAGREIIWSLFLTMGGSVPPRSHSQRRTVAGTPPCGSSNIHTFLPGHSQLQNHHKTLFLSDSPMAQGQPTSNVELRTPSCSFSST